MQPEDKEKKKRREEEEEDDRRLLLTDSERMIHFPLSEPVTKSEPIQKKSLRRSTLVYNNTVTAIIQMTSLDNYMTVITAAVCS